MSNVNVSQPFDPKRFDSVKLNTHAIKSLPEALKEEAKRLSMEEKKKMLLQTISFIDLTTLAGDDTDVNVARLCWRAMKPLSDALMPTIRTENPEFDVDNLKVGAVCVYPARVADCRQSFKGFGLKPTKIACVVTGFPSGQYGLASRLKEIEYASECGADEIDVVINRAMALNGDWQGVYEEVKKMRLASPAMRMKVILEVGELGSLQNVYKASWVAMLAGADYIKTSTGKVSVNATLSVGFVMARAIDEFYKETGVKVGFKPAGGLRTEIDCYCWYRLMQWQLGEEWLRPELFRIGASSLLNEIENSLFKLYLNREAKPCDLSF